MTKVDFKPILNKDEYMVLGNFLSSYMKPNGEKTTRIKCNTKRYNTMFISVNTYNKEELLSVAKERLKSNKITATRREVLNKVIEHINAI